MLTFKVDASLGFIELIENESELASINDNLEKHVASISRATVIDS